MFIEKVNNIALSANADKIIQSMDLVETYVYRTNKEIIKRRKEETKCSNTIKKINYGDITKEKINKHYLNWLQIPDYPRRILTIGGSRCEKPSALINLIKQ